MAEIVVYTYPSFRLLTEALLTRGYAVEKLALDRIYLAFTAPNGNQWLTRRGLISYPFVQPAALQISKHKNLSYAFARLHGVSTPDMLHMPGDQDRLLSFLEQNKPLIVKPSNGFSSHGLTLDIEDKPQLDTALDKAYKVDKHVLVQRQFKGKEVRFMVIDGKIGAAVQRENCQVVGDGVHTIEQLIAAENEVRSMLHHDIVPYPQLDESILDNSVLCSKRVPEQGEVAILRRTSLVAEGGSYREVTAEVHESYKAIALRLGTAINRKFAAVDMLICDFTQPASSDNYVFLEFTFSPSLRLFYDVRSGTDFDIVPIIADMIDDYCKR